MDSVKLLIVSDLKEDLEDIVRQISVDFPQYYTAHDDDTAIVQFDEHEPQVVLLSYEKLERAERFYLSLFRNSEKVHSTPHQSILLCKTTDSKIAYQLCVDGVFDDYVVHKPSYDIDRLRLSVRQSAEKLKLMAESIKTPSSRFRRQGQMRLWQDQPFLEVQTTARPSPNSVPL